ncbi:MAG: hypothetical protein GY950_10445 [bacterium]|nr:hypothetical protein [bacterium]
MAKTKLKPTRGVIFFGKPGTCSIIVLVLVALLFITGCKTKKPTSDSTPPIVKWSILNTATNQTQKITGSGGPIQVKPGDYYKVTCFVEDPEGVQQIMLGGGGSYSCKSGDIGKIVHVDLATQKQDLQPDSSGNVLTKIFIIQNVDLNAWSCKQAGYTFVGGTLTLVGTGKNYFSGTTTANLTFKR